MVGYNERVKVAAQMNRRITTSRDEKSNSALIVYQYFNETYREMSDLDSSSDEMGSRE